ncbi:hypothetical protein Pint_18996 [Pistacia integerrima]|uniref:Uncharacterized protein n=1 Tax=Pistacia integerrima TaxID=434235 RepID=A0ACC0Z0Q2_9ROSI|nr:hypothetical protein Pint_18996 [Pistacia integerrima]
MNMAKNMMGGLCLSILVMILFNANQSTASSWPKSNTTSTFQYCNGSMQDCPIAEDENVELPSVQIAVSLIPSRPFVNCGRGKSRTSCLPDPLNSKITERCGKLYIMSTRNRACA